ncbi:hypothetical protein SAMN02799624_01631 [Paenibacillus sp. UNC496MF]|uniref:hypothetical protein n=1 Tax=Paenibacillus sp. UNC496MF TaxID=1502753 RepID=UPI0008E44149|nr:hypothetical protein [Paenibacillus sp. UNC496MF]SFI61173.1 hypothetical protein SAMN02799624_01631 [Paenibacillus sp. UNC496MF]
MDQERRKTIVKEIEHWQRTKLLPEQYCDFLLNLYLEEGESRKPASFAGRAAVVVKEASAKQWLLTFGIFSLICFIVLYFNVFHPVLQIAVSVTGVYTLLILGQKYRIRSESAGLGLIGAGMLLMLGAGLYMLQLHELQAWGWKAGLLSACALAWVAFGIGARIPLLHLCGWLASFLVYAWLLANKTNAPAWYEIQLYWVPLSFVFGWFSWFVQRWTKPAASMLFAAGALAWFMPELYAALFADAAGGIQLQLIVKIIAGGALLFSLRKQWIAWVA